MHATEDEFATLNQLVNIIANADMNHAQSLR
jgi:hypothetical protein